MKKGRHLAEADQLLQKLGDDGFVVKRASEITLQVQRIFFISIFSQRIARNSYSNNTPPMTLCVKLSSSNLKKNC